MGTPGSGRFPSGLTQRGPSLSACRLRASPASPMSQPRRPGIEAMRGPDGATNFVAPTSACAGSTSPGLDGRPALGGLDGRETAERKMKITIKKRMIKSTMKIKSPRSCTRPSNAAMAGLRCVPALALALNPLPHPTLHLSLSLGRAVSFSNRRAPIGGGY